MNRIKQNLLNFKIWLRSQDKRFIIPVLVIAGAVFCIGLYFLYNSIFSTDAWRNVDYKDADSLKKYWETFEYKNRINSSDPNVLADEIFQFLTGGKNKTKILTRKSEDLRFKPSSFNSFSDGGGTDYFARYSLLYSSFTTEKTNFKKLECGREGKEYDVELYNLIFRSSEGLAYVDPLYVIVKIENKFYIESLGTREVNISPSVKGIKYYISGCKE